jgi:drug/metabolite transporter (DMT)-like permease
MNKDGVMAIFSKPWFATLNMLLAMALVGVVDKAIRMCSPSPAKSSGPDMDYAALPAEDSSKALSYRSKVLMVAWPAWFDLLATAFCCMGMLYIPASVWQMLKGGSIIFCGIFSVTFLKRKLYAFHWLGLITVVLGLATVGLSNVLGNSQQPNSGDSASLLFGMSLVMLGQVVQAAQVIAEEFLMKDVDLRAMEVVGWEGFWGTLMMVVFVYPFLWAMPGADHGHLEDVVDTFTMINNSAPLFFLVLVYLCSCGTFNASGIAVTGALSATHRMMMDASRTSVIWLFGLTVHYKIDASSPYGEAWTSYSFLQLIGFLVLVVGQGIYGEMIKVPGLSYPPPAIDEKQFASPGSLHVATPLPRGQELGQ